MLKHKTGVRRKCVEANGMETTSHYCSFFRRLLMITVVYEKRLKPEC